MTIERKICRLKIDIKEAKGRRIAGYASTYDAPADHDSYGDIIAPGAFNRSVEGLETLPMLNSHDSPIGVWRTFEDDPDGKRGGHPGLWVEGDISATKEGDETLTLINDQAIRGLSWASRSSRPPSSPSTRRAGAIRSARSRRATSSRSVRPRSRRIETHRSSR